MADAPFLKNRPFLLHVLNVQSCTGPFLDGCCMCQFLPGIVASNTRFCVPFSCQYYLGVCCTSLYCQLDICLNNPSIAHFKVCKDVGQGSTNIYDFICINASFLYTLMHEFL